MSAEHVITMRYKDGTTKPIKIAVPGDKDPFDLLAFIEKKLFPKELAANVEARHLAESTKIQHNATQAFSSSSSTTPAGSAALQPSLPSLKSSELALSGASLFNASTQRVRDTSLSAYRALQYSGKLAAQQQKIVDYFLLNPKMRFTRMEIAKDLGIEINAATGRIAELIRPPFNVLRETDDKKHCRITGNRVNALVLATVDDPIPEEVSHAQV